MPAAVPLVGAVAGAAATSAGLFGTTLLGSTLLATAANSFVGLVVSTAINQIGGRALSKKPTPPAFAQEAQGRSIMIRSSVESHKVIYGQMRVAGPIVHAATTNNGVGVATAASDNKMLHLVIPLAGHELQSIDTVY